MIHVHLLSSSRRCETVSPHPDPERIGGLEWTRRTSGRLTRREQLRLLTSIVNSQRDYFLHRLRRDRPSLAARPSDREIRPPDSRFAREVEAAAAEQSPAIIGHSYRSWIFGRALADVDAVELDEELLYAGCLLHDHGIAPAVPGEDFTIRSARRATECAASAQLDGRRATQLSDAITVHTTPGIRVEHDGPLGYYIQAGAMVDIMGNRLWDLSANLVGDTLTRYDRHGFTRELAGHVAAEARAVRGGRFALLRRCGFIPLMHVAPFDQK